MIAIIDYDAGNIRSVEKALLALGQDVTVTADRDEILLHPEPHRCAQIKAAIQGKFQEMVFPFL